MHRLLIMLFLLTLPWLANAQGPKDFFTFQGVARNADGHILAGKNVTLRLSIRPLLPPAIFVEEHHATTNEQGIFTVLVGNGSLMFGNFQDIDWNKLYYLQVEIDPLGGSNYINLGSTQLASVPYAIHAKESGNWLHLEPVIQQGHPNFGSSLPAVGDGNRLIWYPKKAAFLSGFNDGNIWRDENIGQGSAAFGLSSIAKASYSMALGSYTKAFGDASLSAGNFSEARGLNSVSFGNLTIAEGENSIALGDHAISFGKNSFAMGQTAEAHGEASFAMGKNVSAKAFGSATFGAYNNLQDNPAGGKFEQLQQTDRIFQIGNGSGTATLSNALTVLRNGRIGLGNGSLTPQYILDIDGRPRIRHNTETAGLYFDNSEKEPKGFMGMKNDNEIGFYLKDQWRFWVYGTGGATLIGSLEQISDKRMKRDFTSLSQSLYKITQLKGYHYYWKDKSLTQSLQTGFIAQEVEELFPDLVSTSATGVKAVNYISLIPHLVEAIKELKKENEQLKETARRVDGLEENVEALMRMVTKNASRAAASK